MAGMRRAYRRHHIVLLASCRHMNARDLPPAMRSLGRRGGGEDSESEGEGENFTEPDAGVPHEETGRTEGGHSLAADGRQGAFAIYNQNGQILMPSSIFSVVQTTKKYALLAVPIFYRKSRTFDLCEKREASQPP